MDGAGNDRELCVAADPAIAPGGDVAPLPAAPAEAQDQIEAAATAGTGRSRSIAWSMGGQVFSMLASMGSTVVLARILTPTDFGAYAFAATIYGIVQWLLQVGMGNYVLREAELTRRKLDGAFALACAQGLVASLIVLVSAPIAGWFSHYALVGWVTLVMAIVPLLGAPEGVADAVWLRDGRYATIAALQVGKAAVQSLVSIAAHAWFGWGAFALVAGVFAAALLTFLASLAGLMWGKGSRPRIDREQWRVLRDFGGRSFILTLAQIGATRLPDLLIGRLLGVPVLGHYNRAANSIDVFGRTASASVVRATAPHLYARVNAGAPLDEAMANYCDTLLFFVWPAVAGMAVLSAPLIHLLYGPQWDLAVQALPLLCLAFAVDSMRSGGMETLLIRDRLGLNARLEMLHSVYAILLVLLAAPFGLMAVLWARVADSLLTCLVYFAIMRRLGGLSDTELPRVIGRNGLLAAAAVAAPILLMAGWSWPGQLVFGRYLLVIAAGVVPWLATLALLRHPFLVQGLAIARRRLRPAAA